MTVTTIAADNMTASAGNMTDANKNKLTICRVIVMSAFEARNKIVNRNLLNPRPSIIIFLMI
jgi:hypothetical protein